MCIYIYTYIYIDRSLGAMTAAVAVRPSLGIQLRGVSRGGGVKMQHPETIDTMHYSIHHITRTSWQPGYLHHKRKQIANACFCFRLV